MCVICATLFWVVLNHMVYDVTDMTSWLHAISVTWIFPFSMEYWVFYAIFQRFHSRRWLVLSVSMHVVIVSLIPFIAVRIILTFTTSLTISSEQIVILLYNYFILIVFVLNCHLMKMFCCKRILCLNNFIFRWYIAGCIAERFLKLNFHNVIF